MSNPTYYDWFFADAFLIGAICHFIAFQRIWNKIQKLNDEIRKLKYKIQNLDSNNS